MEDENLDIGEKLKISVEFLSYKSQQVLEELQDCIPKNMIDKHGKTLLHWAVQQGNSAKASYLAEAGLAQPDLKDFEGVSAVELAWKKKNLKIIKYFISLGYSCVVKSQIALNPEVNLDIEGRIVNCIYADNEEELRNNMIYVTNINGFFSLYDYYEWTLLGVAGFHLSPKCLEYLIRLGCSPTVKEGDGLSFIDNVFNAIIEVTPPETEEEFVNFNSGIETLLVLLNTVKNLKDYKLRLTSIFNKSELVGKFSSAATNKYEEQVVTKNLVFRLTLGKYLDSLG